MSLGSDIYTVAAAHAGLKALIDNRIFPIEIPNGEALPAVAWQVITADPNNSLAEAASENDATHIVQFTVLADDFDKIETIGAQLLSAFDNVAVFNSRRARCSNWGDLPSDLPGRYARFYEFTI